MNAFNPLASRQVPGYVALTLHTQGRRPCTPAAHPQAGETANGNVRDWPTHDRPMKLHVYIRRANGLVIYKGRQPWASKAQCLQSFHRADAPVEIEETTGRPYGLIHARIEWHGDLGFGLD